MPYSAYFHIAARRATVHDSMCHHLRDRKTEGPDNGWWEDDFQSEAHALHEVVLFNEKQGGTLPRATRQVLWWGNSGNPTLRGFQSLHKNDAVVDRMCSSIREFGFKIPVLARSDSEVVDGHLRLETAREPSRGTPGHLRKVSYVELEAALARTTEEQKVKLQLIRSPRRIGVTEEQFADPAGQGLRFPLPKRAPSDFPRRPEGAGGRSTNSLLPSLLHRPEGLGRTSSRHGRDGLGGSR